ncbi:MAG: DUF134 domain-containing protein [Alphaproteobacteria bacterium]|nr:DUF134 domain-containing protein [Alphaproteobacteria bacterium]
MVRPRKCRRVHGCPVSRFFRPHEIPLSALETLVLKEEELEALALADGRGLDQETAAGLMNVSRPTFSRILAQARRTVAAALVEGAALEIGGGDFHRPELDSGLTEKEMNMPMMDKTGPMGTGPVGRGRGGCARSDEESERFAGEGRGGRGRCHGGPHGGPHGGGRGQGRCCDVGRRAVAETMSPEQEAAFLEQKIGELQSRLDALRG